MASKTDIVAFFITSADNGPAIIDSQSSNDITVVSSAGQIVGSAIGLTVSSATSVGLTNLAGMAGVSGFVTAVKVSVDVQNGREIALGDAITLVGNGVMVVAGVAVLGGVALQSS